MIPFAFVGPAPTIPAVSDVRSGTTVGFGGTGTLDVTGGGGVKTVSSIVAGGTLAIVRGDTASHSITGLGDLTGRAKLYLTIKYAPDVEADAQAELQVEETAGCLKLARKTPTDATVASLEVDDADAGDITLTLGAAASATLHPGTYSYDVKMVADDDTAASLASGTATVGSDVTLAAP